MSIDTKYNICDVPKHMIIPSGSFPKAVRERLLRALSGTKRSWQKMDIDTLRQNGAALLRVTLDVGDRPLHIFVHQDGDVVQIDAPIFADFPAAASHFVLTDLCGGNTYVSFRIDDQQLLDSAGNEAAKATPVLYAWGRFDFPKFVALAPTLLPYLIGKLTEAEVDLRAHLDEPKPTPVGLAA